MQNLLDFLRKYNYWFLFVLLEVSSCVLLFSFNPYQSSVFFTSANSVVATVNEKRTALLAFFRLKAANRELTHRNVLLQRQLSELRTYIATKEADTTAAEKRMLASLKGYRLVAATVVSNSVNKANNYIVIDKGAADNIHPEMGVVGSGGVVGIVSLTERHHSLVVPVLNANSKISCRVRGHQFFGYLQWQGGSPLTAYVTDIPLHARVKVGDYMETSGYSAVFPPGIFVGRVTKKENTDDGLSLRLQVNLGTDFANLRDVLVVANYHKKEFDSLQLKQETAN